MKSNRPSLSSSELEVLKVLWDEGPGTVREINHILKGRGRRWVYTTVQTLLNRLASKGYVTCDKARFAHVFRPALSRDAFMRQGLHELADQVCDGTPVPLVFALVEDHRFTPEEIERFRKLLDDLEPQKKGRKPKTRKK